MLFRHRTGCVCGVVYLFFIRNFSFTQITLIFHSYFACKYKNILVYNPSCKCLKKKKMNLNQSTMPVTCQQHSPNSFIFSVFLSSFFYSLSNKCFGFCNLFSVIDNFETSIFFLLSLIYTPSFSKNKVAILYDKPLHMQRMSCGKYSQKAKSTHDSTLHCISGGDRIEGKQLHYKENVLVGYRLHWRTCIVTRKPAHHGIICPQHSIFPSGHNPSLVFSPAEIAQNYLKKRLSSHLYLELPHSLTQASHHPLLNLFLAGEPVKFIRYYLQEFIRGCRMIGIIITAKKITTRKYQGLWKGFLILLSLKPKPYTRPRPQPGSCKGGIPNGWCVQIKSCKISCILNSFYSVFILKDCMTSVQQYSFNAVLECELKSLRSLKSLNLETHHHHKQHKPILLQTHTHFLLFQASPHKQHPRSIPNCTQGSISFNNSAHGPYLLTQRSQGQGPAPHILVLSIPALLHYCHHVSTQKPSYFLSLVNLNTCQVFLSGHLGKIHGFLFAWNSFSNCGPPLQRRLAQLTAVDMQHAPAKLLQRTMLKYDKWQIIGCAVTFTSAIYRHGMIIMFFFLFFSMTIISFPDHFGQGNLLVLSDTNSQVNLPSATLLIWIKSLFWQGNQHNAKGFSTNKKKHSFLAQNNLQLTVNFGYVPDPLYLVCSRYDLDGFTCSLLLMDIGHVKTCPLTINKNGIN
ncbi:hypothetical protein VP01_130g4 [Puccinia sorghi]|uniref:Uncharacterized protein n=1 Tax=Puccinia sorghi TaxID=27349 RepID=A0A0L6VMW6_9BASI|nr:hypothetical protein VP01_130g4 [Puccinia sorghi]